MENKITKIIDIETIKDNTKEDLTNKAIESNSDIVDLTKVDNIDNNINNKEDFNQDYNLKNNTNIEFDENKRIERKKEEEKGKSTTEDYFRTMNDMFEFVNFEEQNIDTLKYSQENVHNLDLKSEELKKALNDSDRETRELMLSSDNTQKALRIYNKRKRYTESAERIAKDDLTKQFGMGAVSAIISPTTLIGFTSVVKLGVTAGKAMKLAGVISNLSKLKKYKLLGDVGKNIGKGTIAGVSGNVASEALFDIQDLQHDYISAAAFGAMLGGGLPALTASLNGTFRKTASRLILKDSVSHSRAVSDNVNVKLTKSGEVQLHAENENVIVKQNKYGKDEYYFIDKETLVEKKVDINSDAYKIAKEKHKIEVELKKNTKKLNREKYNNKLKKSEDGWKKNIKKNKEDIKKREKDIKAFKKTYLEMKDAIKKGLLNEKDIEKFPKGSLESIIKEKFPKIKPIKGTAKEKALKDVGNYKEDYYKKIKFNHPIEMVPMERKINNPLNSGVFEVTKKGNIQIIDNVDKAKKILTDWLPGLGDLLMSDTTKLQQSDNVIMRAWGNLAAGSIEGVKKDGVEITKEKSAYEFKNEMIAKSTMMKYKKQFMHSKSVENGYVGKYEEWDAQLDKESKKYIDNQERELDLYINGEKNKATLNGKKLSNKEEKILIENWYNKNKVVHSEGYFKDALDYQQKFFNEYLDKMQETGIKGLSINKNKYYYPRMYDAKKMKELGYRNVEEVFYKSLKSHPYNSRYTNAELKTMSREFADKFQMKDNNQGLNLFDYLDNDGTYEAGNLKGKKFKLDDTLLNDITMDNADSVVSFYTKKMSGDIALKNKFGTSDIQEIMDEVFEKSNEKGYKIEDKDKTALKNVLLDIKGDLRIIKDAETIGWRISNALTGTSTFMFGLSFGANQTIETAGIIGMNGFEDLNKLFSKALKNEINNIKGIENKSEIHELFMGAGMFENALKYERIMRQADYEEGAISDVFDLKLRQAGNFIFKINGVRQLTNMTEEYVGSLTVNRIMKGDYSLDDLKRLGLTEERAKSLKVDLEKTWDIKKEDWKISEMSKENREALQLAVMRQVEKMVIKSDSIHAPSWMKIPNPYIKVLFQFMRFPMIAGNTLLRAGWIENRANLAINLITGSLVYANQKWLREELSVDLGFKNEEDRQYDIYNNREQLLNVFTQSLGMSAATGFLSSIYNYAATMTGRPELGRTWSNGDLSGMFGVSASTIEKIREPLVRLLDGKPLTSRNIKQLVSFIPLFNIPIVSEAKNDIINKNYN